MAAWRPQTVIAGLLIVVHPANLRAQRPLTPMPEEGQQAITGKFPSVRYTTLNGAARVSAGVDQNSWRELRLRISVENLTPALLGAPEIGMAVLDGDRHAIPPAPKEKLERRIERNLAVAPPGPPPTGYNVHSHSTTSGDINTDTTGHTSITPDTRLYWVRTARRYEDAQDAARLTQDNLAELRRRQGDWEHPLVPGEIRDGEFWYVPSDSANLSAITVVLVLPEDDQVNGKAELLRFRFQGLQPGSQSKPLRRKHRAH